MLLTDLRELKKYLDIEPGDTSEDSKLSFFVEHASQWIEELLDRPGLSFKSRTEFYQGTGTQRLPVRSRPVYTSPTVQVFVDDVGYFGSASGSFASTTALTYGTDFAVQVDQEDGTSRSGILLRLNDTWPKPQVRQFGYLSPFVWSAQGNVKVIYTAGYTVDTLPSVFRLAVNLLVARMRYLFPLGMEIGSESYEERSISLIADRKDYLIAQIRPMLWNYRNWTFGAK